MLVVFIPPNITCNWTRYCTQYTASVAWPGSALDVATEYYAPIPLLSPAFLVGRMGCHPSALRVSLTAGERRVAVTCLGKAQMYDDQRGQMERGEQPKGY